MLAQGERKRSDDWLLVTGRLTAIETNERFSEGRVGKSRPMEFYAMSNVSEFILYTFSVADLQFVMVSNSVAILHLAGEINRVAVYTGEIMAG